MEDQCSGDYKKNIYNFKYTSQKGVEIRQAEYQTATTDGRLNSWKTKAHILSGNHQNHKPTVLAMITVTVEDVMLCFWSDHMQQR